MRNTCRNKNIKFTVGMLVEDWTNILTMYTVNDDEGDKIWDSILLGCELAPEDESVKECTFLLGKVKNNNAHGVTEKWQDIAGWLTDFGSQGVQWYYTDWVNKNKTFPPSEKTCGE